jgi:hypothetical protein
MFNSSNWTSLCLEFNVSYNTTFTAFETDWTANDSNASNSTTGFSSATYTMDASSTAPWNLSNDSNVTEYPWYGDDAGGSKTNGSNDTNVSAIWAAEATQSCLELCLEGFNITNSTNDSISLSIRAHCIAECFSVPLTKAASDGNVSQPSASPTVDNRRCHVLDVTVLGAPLCPIPSGTRGIALKPTAAGFAHNATPIDSKFRFTQPLGISTIQPASGLTDGGTIVTLTGVGLGEAARVRFTDTGGDCLVMGTPNSTSLQCITPPTAVGQSGTSGVSLAMGMPKAELVAWDKRCPSGRLQGGSSLKMGFTAAASLNAMECAARCAAAFWEGCRSFNLGHFGPHAGWCELVDGLCDEPFVESQDTGFYHLIDGDSIGTFQQWGPQLGVGALSFRFISQAEVLSIDPTEGARGDLLVVQGSGFGSTTGAVLFGQRFPHGDIDNDADYGPYYATLAGSCNVTTWRDDQVKCLVGALPAGAYELRVQVPGMGDIRSPQPFLSLLNVSAAGNGIPVEQENVTTVDTLESGFGGGTLLTLRGIGFGAGVGSTTVRVCGQPCAPVSSEYDRVTCRGPELLTSDLLGLARRAPSELRPDEGGLIATGRPRYQGELIRTFDGLVDDSAAYLNDDFSLGLDAEQGRFMLLSDVAYYVAPEMWLREKLFRSRIFVANFSSPWIDTFVGVAEMPRAGWNVLAFSVPVLAQRVRFVSPEPLPVPVPYEIDNSTNASYTKRPKWIPIDPNCTNFTNMTWNETNYTNFSFVNHPNATPYEYTERPDIVWCVYNFTDEYEEEEEIAYDSTDAEPQTWAPNYTNETPNVTNFSNISENRSEFIGTESRTSAPYFFEGNVTTPPPPPPPPEQGPLRELSFRGYILAAVPASGDCGIDVSVYDARANSSAAAQVAKVDLASAAFDSRNGSVRMDDATVEVPPGGSVELRLFVPKFNATLLSISLEAVPSVRGLTNATLALRNEDGEIEVVYFNYPLPENQTHWPKGEWVWSRPAIPTQMIPTGIITAILSGVWADGFESHTEPMLARSLTVTPSESATFLLPSAPVIHHYNTSETSSSTASMMNDSSMGELSNRVFFQHKLELTPVVQSVTPDLGDARGGMEVALKGHLLRCPRQVQMENISVILGGLPCPVYHQFRSNAAVDQVGSSRQDEGFHDSELFDAPSAEHVSCKPSDYTLARLAGEVAAVKDTVRVYVPGCGNAVHDEDVSFTYFDRWSDPLTWPAGEAPLEGASVEIGFGRPWFLI